MIGGHLTAALKRQDWLTVCIEFFLIIAGVLIALQVDQWNGARKERAQEIAFLAVVRDDILMDIVDLKNSIQALTTISDFGDTAATTFGEAACAEHCRAKLLAFFQASQWISLQSTRTTYDEIKRTGWPRDASLKEVLTRYYVLREQWNNIWTQLPRYREVVRSIIPADVQEQYWRNCFDVIGRKQTFLSDCDVSISEDEAQVILNRIQSDDEVESSLNYWMSTVSLIKETLPRQIAEGEVVVETLSKYVEHRE
jgi:hypothetical protein